MKEKSFKAIFAHLIEGLDKVLRGVARGTVGTVCTVPDFLHFHSGWF